MALYGVLGDIHGNREALEAALALLDARGMERLLCLGDLIGYNADPDECAALIRERDALAIAGNHDLIGISRLDFSRCSNKARYALSRTRRSLSGDTEKYLAALPPHRVVEDRIVLIHGGVRDVQQYMVSADHIRQNAEYARTDFPGARLFLFGHTHEPKVYEIEGGQVREVEPGDGLLLREDRVYFINPGSIDAARKRAHKMAECAVLDSTAWRIDFHRVPYNEPAAETRAARAGYRIGPLFDRAYTLQRRLGNLWRRVVSPFRVSARGPGRGPSADQAR